MTYAISFHQNTIKIKAQKLHFEAQTIKILLCERE